MKKSFFKKKYAEIFQQNVKNIIKLYDAQIDIAELKEALDRRRQLCKTMEELVNRNQPKSMEEMARALRQHEREIAEELGILDRCEYQKLSWEDLPQEAKDGFYDALLKIIG